MMVIILQTDVYSFCGALLLLQIEVRLPDNKIESGWLQFYDLSLYKIVPTANGFPVISTPLLHIHVAYK